MKLLSIVVFTLFSISTIWLNDFSVAQKQAQESHKHILINFSGSDWCGPCIRLRTEILASSIFEKYAEDHLVLVNADFPRLKKNQLTKEQVKRNEALADLYNKEGKFPFTVLVDEHGKVLKTWDGFPDQSPEEFVAGIEKLNK